MRPRCWTFFNGFSQQRYQIPKLDAARADLSFRNPVFDNSKIDTSPSIPSHSQRFEWSDRQGICEFNIGLRDNLI